MATLFRIFAWLSLILGAASQSACGLGLKTPDTAEPFEGPDATKVRINAVEAHVKCELRRAVQGIIYTDIVFAEHNAPLGRSLRWFEQWGAKASLAVQAEEKGELNPAVSFQTPMIGASTYFPDGTFVPSSQSYALGLGGEFSSLANRRISKDFYLAFNPFLTGPDFEDYVRLRRTRQTPKCDHLDGLLIEGDLKIKEWLEDELLSFMTGVSNRPGSSDSVDSPTTSIETKITFTIKTGASITPTWNLVRIAANSSGIFAGASRTRVYELDVTLGPTVLAEVEKIKTNRGKLISFKHYVPSPELNSNFFANKIGSDVASSIRANR